MNLETDGAQTEATDPNIRAKKLASSVLKESKSASPKEEEYNRIWVRAQQKSFEVRNGKLATVIQSSQDLWYIGIPVEWTIHPGWLSRKDVKKLRKELKVMLDKAESMT